jgi:hypothetical protein
MYRATTPNSLNLSLTASVNPFIRHTMRFSLLLCLAAIMIVDSGAL